MKILITGAFGNLGLMCVEQAIALDYNVRCFDLDTKKNRKLADSYGDRIESIFGNIKDGNVLIQLLDGIDAIIHNASLLPPITENSPELSNEINVQACQNLIHMAEVRPNNPIFIFPSSVTVFGLPTENKTLKKSSDPVEATDNYTRQKITIEETLKNSSLPWVILRVGVSVDTRTLATDRKTLKQLLNVMPDNPLEYIHPKDVAFAMCKAASTQEAQKKVLLLGGGKNCQITQRDFMNTAFESLGISLPLSAHGNKPYYTHWMDTAESQKILQFQRHNFTNYQNEMAQKLKAIRIILFPFRWILSALLPLILSWL